MWIERSVRSALSSGRCGRCGAISAHSRRTASTSQASKQRRSSAACFMALAHRVYASDIVLAVVRRGVTPLPQAMVGEIAPLHRMACAPVGGLALLFAVAKNVAVAPVPPVPAGKSMLAAGEMVPFDDADQPPVERPTLTRV